MSGAGGSILIVDVGTSSVRVGVVRPDASIDSMHQEPILPSTPAPGLVEVDAARIAEVVLGLATAALSERGPVAGVGIANQRATTVVWERATGRPVAPGIGWQDLRTVLKCLTLQAEGIRVAPNASATKLAAILDDVDPGRERADGGLCFGTLDTWTTWTLSGGAGGDRLHVTDATNAAVTGLLRLDTLAWDPRVLEVLGVPASMLPAVVDSSGLIGPATALPGAPPICGMAGDQQASMVGQGCTAAGRAKATFGTGAMLDLCTGATPPSGGLESNPAGTFPIVAWQRSGTTVWGVEAMMLSAGSCVEWLRDDLGLIASAEETGAVASACVDTGDVWFVPALLGLGTPVWDFGARGTIVGITRGTGRPQLVRAVLEGIAQRGADLLESAEADSGLTSPTLRVDGGMSGNEPFVQALADATGRPVEVAPVTEATTLGAGFLAGMAIGTWADESDVAAAFRPRATVLPGLGDEARRARRERWLEARRRAERTIPELSGISF